MDLRKYFQKLNLQEVSSNSYLWQSITALETAFETEESKTLGTIKDMFNCSSETH